MCNVQPEADLGGKIMSSPIPKPEASVKTRLEVRGTAAQKKYMGMFSAGLCDIFIKTADRGDPYNIKVV